MVCWAGHWSKLETAGDAPPPSDEVYATMDPNQAGGGENMYVMLAGDGAMLLWQLHLPSRAWCGFTFTGWAVKPPSVCMDSPPPAVRRSGLRKR
eukprot:1177154-Prorocentrum_minimum.AAC.1